MQQRLTAMFVLAGLAGLGLCAVLLSAGAAGPSGQRISFQIATGSTAGSFFPVGEAIAGLISHPPGLDRCEAAPVCGPSGLIVSARTSQGAADNVTEVNNGDSESGLAHGDVVAAAVRGATPFHGRATHLRVIASLFDENVQLVASSRSGIKSPANLAGKRVSLGEEGAGTGVTLREILSAYGVSEHSIKLQRPDANGDVVQMRAGKLDAFLVVGGGAVPGLADLFAAGKARLVPITGSARERLIKRSVLMPATIPAGLYPGQAATPTVATRALWIVRDSVPPDLVFGIAKALYHPFNHAALAASDPEAGQIRLMDATMNLPAPLHPGAARYYKSVMR